MHSKDWKTWLRFRCKIILSRLYPALLLQVTYLNYLWRIRAPALYFYPTKIRFKKRKWYILSDPIRSRYIFLICNNLLSYKYYLWHENKSLILCQGVWMRFWLDIFHLFLTKPVRSDLDHVKKWSSTSLSSRYNSIRYNYLLEWTHRALEFFEKTCSYLYK